MGRTISFVALIVLGVVTLAIFSETVSGHHDHDHKDEAEKLEVAFNSGSGNGNATTTTAVNIKPEDLTNYANSTSRSKRQTAVGGSASPESLLAQCQLTNLLLYQALQQQRQNPLLALATSNLNIQGLGSSPNLNLNSLPLPLGAQPPPGLANLLNPALPINPYPSLHTYTTTSSYVTKMTTTALVTVPLLFGNKPLTTTITRTKILDVTTSEVKTLTSTITPTLVIKTTAVVSPETVVVTPTVSPTPALEKSNEYDQYPEDEYQQNDVPVEQQSSPVPKRSAVSSANKKILLRNSASKSKPQQVELDYQDSTKSSKSRGTSTYASPTPATVPEKKQRRKPSRTQTKDEDYSIPVSTSKPSKLRNAPQQYDNPAEYDYYNAYGTTGSAAATKKTSTTGSSSRSKNKKQPSTYSEPILNQDQFYQRQYGTSSLQEDDQPVEEDPALVQYPDDYGYYNRRLKRGEQHAKEEEDDEEPTKLEREYLLEPSSDGDYSGNYQKYEKCPPINSPAVTVTVTSVETRTITKFLNGRNQPTPTPALRQVYDQPTATINSNTGFRNFIPQKDNSASSGQSSRRRSFRNRNRDLTQQATSDSASVTTPSSSQPDRTTSGSGGDPRAQILRRGRTRYSTPSPNNNQQQEYDDYYRG